MARSALRLPLHTGRSAEAGRPTALLRHQYSDREPFARSNVLRRLLEHMRGLIEVLPARVVELRCCGRPAMVVASDGRADDVGAPTLSVLVHDPDDLLLELWGRPAQPIANIEQAAVMAGTVAFASKSRGRSILWFEDNTIALAGLVKGSSSASELGQGANVVHMMTAAL